jgi:hypothetical protein
MIFERKLVKQGVLPDAAFPHHSEPRAVDAKAAGTLHPF